jgi:hypothetical protein
MKHKVGFLEKIFGENFPKVVTEYYESGQKKSEGTVIGKNLEVFIQKMDCGLLV